MATSSNSTWLKGFTGSPNGEACTSTGLAELLAEIGNERVRYPVDDSTAPVMSRREIVGRVLWTRAVVDGDLAAIKVLLEYLGGKPGDGDGGERGATLNADHWSAAEHELIAWRAAWPAVAVTADAKEAEGDGGAA